MECYGDTLAPYVHEQIAKGAKPGDPLDPMRFSDIILKEKECSYGRSGFALQFMLDPQLADEDRYPLKLRDLIFTDLDTDIVPLNIVYGSSPDQVIETHESVGFTGDRLHRPMYVSKEDFTAYTGSILYVDPSGRGQDETGWVVTKFYAGRIHLLEAGGLKGGYDDTSLEELAEIAKRHKVNLVLIEPNFGDGMYTELLKPVMRRVYNVRVEDADRVTAQKELRCIDTLEPVMNQHRIVVNSSLIEADRKADIKCQLFYQMTRMCRERGALTKDDRIDALEGGVRYWNKYMAQDSEVVAMRHKARLKDQELEAFIKSARGGQTQSGWTPPRRPYPLIINQKEIDTTMIIKEWYRA